MHVSKGLFTNSVALRSVPSGAVRVLLVAAASAVALPGMVQAQTVAATTNQSGTVTAAAVGSITITTKAGSETVTPGEGARILQIAPGATDLKSATPVALTDIAVGDKVLVAGHAGDSASAFVATRIVVLKSGDIASLHAAQSADWQKRGTGGLVKEVSGPSLTVTNGSKSLTVNTTPATIYRRYAGDSIKFEDAKAGTLGEIQTGDQLRVRGAKSDDGTAITAEEIVSGSFENLAGVISAVDAAQGTVTLKDLATKKVVVVRVTANSEVRHLPAMAAASFAKAHAPAAAGAPAAAATPPAASEGGQRRAGMDLSQMLTRLPAQPLADLKAGDAVLIVASKGVDSVTAVTMLSGVEPILSASPTGAAPTLSPWNLGVPEGAAGGGGQ